MRYSENTNKLLDEVINNWRLKYQVTNYIIINL